MVANLDTLTGEARFSRYSLPWRLTALLVLALLQAASAVAAEGPEIDAVIGFSGSFEPGRWTPLNVAVTNRGGHFTGHVEVEVAGGDELRGRLFVTTYRRKLELHGPSRKRLQFTVLPQGLGFPVVVRLRSGGRELARTEIDLRTRFAAGRLLLLLSRDANLGDLNDGGADGLRVLYPHPELLPVHWRGYNAVTAMVVHGVSLERLSANQFDALQKWIAQGGILAVSGGPDYALLRSPRLASLLPGQPVGMTRVNAGDLQSAFPGLLDVSRPVPVHRLGALRGRVLRHAGSVPLIVERKLGLGRVIYLTFDVAGYPFDRWDGMHKLWLDTLRLPPRAMALPNAAAPVREDPLRALLSAEARHFPSHATALFFIALYLGLLLAGYRLSLHANRRRPLTALAAWAAPALFAPAAWLLFGPASFPRGGAIVTTALIEPLPDSAYARLDLDVGLYGNRSGSLRLEYAGAEPVLYPPLRAQRDGSAEDWILGESDPGYLEPRDRRRYVLHALHGEDMIAFHVEASLGDEAMGPRLDLLNASGQTLEDLWLFFRGHAYSLGSIAAGARVVRRLERRADGIELGEASWRRVLKPPAGASEQTVDAIRIMLDRRVKEAGESGYPAPGHALLIAYAQSPLRPAGASSGWTRAERAVVAFQVASSAGDASRERIGSALPRSDDSDAERRALSRSRAAAAYALQWDE